MSFLNVAHLIGNVTADPVFNMTQDGKAICSFTVATNQRWRTPNGERKEKPEYHRCIAWDKQAERASQFLKKGDKIYIEGRIQTREWEAPDGSHNQQTEIVVLSFIDLTPANKINFYE